MRAEVITKSKMEDMCRAAGMVPVARRYVGDHEIFVADGKSATPHRSFAKFNVDENDFPGGCYATLWFTSCGEKLDIGQPLFFELFHNPELSHESKREARINSALTEAKKFLDRRKKAQH